MKTITVELIREDAWDLIRQLERLSILRIKKPKTTTQKSTPSPISKLRGSLKLNMTVEEIDHSLKTLQDEWERDIY